MGEKARHLEAVVTTTGTLGLIGTMAWMGIGVVLSGIFQMLLVGFFLLILAPGVYRGVYEEDNDDCDHQWTSNRQAPVAEYECLKCGEIEIRE